MDFTRVFNLWEARLWAVVALALLWRSRAESPSCRRALLWLVPVFLLFGVSDLIEACTGLWWRPWWLGVLKAGCGAAIGLGFWRYFAGKQPKK